MASRKVIEQLAVTAELCGAQISPAAARAFAEELGRYPEAEVLKALGRVARETTGRLSLAAVIERISDGRPGPDEAWGLVATSDEGETVVCTTEALEARAACGSLLGSDETGARMAFRDRYRALVAENRATGTPVRWVASLGHDVPRRQSVIARAVQEGRLTAEYAAGLLGVTPAQLAPAAGPALPRSPATPMLAAAVCTEGWCDGRWHYAEDPEQVRRPGVTACPRRGAP